MDESDTRRRPARLRTWMRVSLVVGLILAATLVTALLLSASGVGDRDSPMARDQVATAGGQMHGDAPGHGGGGQDGGGGHGASGADCP